MILGSKFRTSGGGPGCLGCITWQHFRTEFMELRKNIEVNHISPKRSKIPPFWFHQFIGLENYQNQNHYIAEKWTKFVPWKRKHFKRKIVFQPSIFQVIFVSFRGGYPLWDGHLASENWCYLEDFIWLPFGAFEQPDSLRECNFVKESIYLPD